MSKVEELASKYATIERSDGEGGIDITSYVAFIDGYNQAEKDNALTWEDIPKIVSICEHLKVIWWFTNNEETDKQLFFEEVLKRFNYDKRRTRHCYET